MTETLLTIGYESARFDAVRDALVAAGTALLIDVRAVAASRRAGFSKRILAAGLAEAGIDYVHLQPLGTPKAGRDAARRGDVETMHAIFLEHMQGDHAQAALHQARTLASGKRACLLCFERDHAGCHRSLVAEMIGQPVLHLAPHLDLPPPTPKRPRRASKDIPA